MNIYTIVSLKAHIINRLSAKSVNYRTQIYTKLAPKIMLYQSKLICRYAIPIIQKIRYGWFLSSKISRNGKFYLVIRLQSSIIRDFYKVICLPCGIYIDLLRRHFYELTLPTAICCCWFIGLLYYPVNVSFITRLPCLAF